MGLFCLKSTKEYKPWQDKSGRNLSVAKLKKCSKDWDEETWQLYLKSEVEKDLKEDLISNKDCAIERKNCHIDKIDVFSNEVDYQDIFMERFIFDGYSFEEPSESIIYMLYKGICELSRIENEIITMIYWKNLSLKQVSDLFSISLYSAYLLKKSALNKIHNRILDSDTDEYIQGA